MHTISFQHIFWLLLLAPVSTFAGHGFVTAFANIEGLPDPGRTPDSAWYRLDAWQEEGRLTLARNPEAKVRLYLAFTREKLAEIEMMVKVKNTQAAEIAADRYQLYLDQARHLILSARETTTKEALADLMANALLDQQYILSVIYEEMPVASRSVVSQVITTAQERYQNISRLLPLKKQKALFFKEEEVRWSVRMVLTPTPTYATGEGEKFQKEEEP